MKLKNSFLGNRFVNEKLKNVIRRKLEIMNYPIDMEDGKEIYLKCKDYTQTSLERIYMLQKAVRYLEKRNIKGDLVECGVWKGGSCMVMAYSLKKKNRKIYLYDTFTGMSEPNKIDTFTQINLNAKEKWKKKQKDNYNSWNYANLGEVKMNMKLTKYPKDKLVFVKGKVEDTIPLTIPKKIALLRIDTDWYKPTKHCLEHLYPKLVKGGVIIFDDYGYLKGAKKAVDEFFIKKRRILLTRIDNCCRIGVKLNIT
jgi:O-methyltransferase